MTLILELCCKSYDYSASGALPGREPLPLALHIEML